MTVNLSELKPGTELELTYDGSRGARTITVYVADYDRSPCVVEEWERDDVELRLGDTDAGRFLRLGFSVSEDSDEWDYEDDYTNVRSLNSKAKRGRRLGTVLDMDVLDSSDDRGVSVHEYRTATTGDVVQVDDREGVVTDDGYGVTVEFGDGDTVDLRSMARRGVYYTDYSGEGRGYETVVVEEFSRTGETVEPSDEESDLFEVFQDYGHGAERGKVVAVDLDGTRYELTYRHDADEEGIRFTGPNSTRDGDLRLRLDPLGLVFNGSRIQVEDLTLVYGEETDEDEESEFDTVDARETDTDDEDREFEEGDRVFLRGEDFSGNSRDFHATVTTVTAGGDVFRFSTDEEELGYYQRESGEAYADRWALRVEEVGHLDDEEADEDDDEDDDSGRECYAEGCSEDARERSSYCSEECYEDVHGHTPAELLDPDADPHGDEENQLRTDGGVEPVRPRFTLPEDHYYGRTVEGGVWHIFDEDERRSACGIYNDDGVIHGSTRGLDRTDLPSEVCGSCVGAVPYLELYEEETVEVEGKEVPEPLAGFYQDDLKGLFAVRPGSGRDSVILYESCRRVGGRAAVEIANDEPRINDESDYPGVSPPRCSFPELVGEYGLTYEVIGPNTYVYLTEGGR